MRKVFATAISVCVLISTVGCATHPGQISQCELANLKKESKKTRFSPPNDIYWADSGENVLVAERTL